MWWVVLVVLSYLDRELAVGAVVGASRGRLSAECGGPRGSQPFTRMDEAKRRGSGGPAEVTRRSKRGFTYPGTLWCGAGNMADHYDQLGEFKETDSCCRTHDHCPHVIHAFSSKYGYTNFKWHSICHCDCDEALRACLRHVNDTPSRVMGQAFFNVIAAPCFELVYEERCAERHWYGLCKRYDKLPVALVKEAAPYDYGGVAVIDVLTGAPPIGKDDNKQESATQATPSGPEEPSLGNAVDAAEDVGKALAAPASSDKKSQSLDRKRKKDSARKKKAKGKGPKRKQKVVRAEEVAPVSPSGGKNDDEDVPRRNSMSHPTATQRLSAGPSARTSDDVMKDQPLMQTAELRPTAAPAGGDEIPQLAVDSANNLTAVLVSRAEQRPGEEMPRPGANSADILRGESPSTAEESRPRAGSRSKNGLPRKSRRKEKPPLTSLEEIPQLALDLTEDRSATTLPGIPTSPQRHLNKRLNLGVTSPTAEESSGAVGSRSKSGRQAKRGRKEKVFATSPKDVVQPTVDNADNVLAVLTSGPQRRHPGGKIAQPERDSAHIPSVSPTLSTLTLQQQRLDQASPRSADVQSVISIAVMPTPHQSSQAGLESDSVPASQAEQGRGEKIPRVASSPSAIGVSQPEQQNRGGTGPPGTPNGKRKPADSEGRKTTRKLQPAQSVPPEPTAELAPKSDIVTAGGLTLQIAKRQMSTKSLTTSSPADLGSCVAPTTKPREKTRPVDVGRRFPSPQFPSLTSAPAAAEETVAKWRPGVSAILPASAAQRSLERAREQFARKKRRKAALSVSAR